MKEKHDHLEHEDVIGLIVHGYNNYLSGIMGFTELALLDCDQNETSERLQSTLVSTSQAVNFGKQLLSSISRLQVSQQALALLPLLESLCQKLDCRLLVDNKFAGVVNTNQQWFESCMTSLIQFCRDYINNRNLKGPEKKSSEPSEISLKVFCEEGTVKLYLLTPGILLSDKQDTHLFEPFYSSRTLLGQSGVGLAVVKGFMRQMKGDLVWLPEHGFEISLPLVSNSVEVKNSVETPSR